MRGLDAKSAMLLFTGGGIVVLGAVMVLWGLAP